MPQQNLNCVWGSSQKASAKMIHFSLWLLNFLLPSTWREQNWCDAICILCNPLFLLASKQHNNFYELIRYFYLLNKHTCLKKATFWLVVTFVSHFSCSFEIMRLTYLNETEGLSKPQIAINLKNIYDQMLWINTWLLHFL